jgi:hypothetical protein
MFQKKVTIKKNGNICIEVSNGVREVKFDISNGTSYHDAKKMVFEDFRKASYIFINPREVKDYPKFKLVIDEIIDSIYSIGLNKLDPEKNFAEYDLVKEE